MNYFSHRPILVPKSKAGQEDPIKALQILCFDLMPRKYWQDKAIRTLNLIELSNVKCLLQNILHNLKHKQ